MLSGEQSYKKSYVSVLECGSVCVFTSRQTSTFLALHFCFGKAKPQRTHCINDPCLELTDSRVEENSCTLRG